MTEYTITNEQMVPATLTITTATGKPAIVDGKPTWTIISGDSTIKIADDGLSAFLISSDKPGDTSFLVEADADRGVGVENISDTVLLHVAGAKASSLGLKLGTPVAK